MQHGFSSSFNELEGIYHWDEYWFYPAADTSQPTFTRLEYTVHEELVFERIPLSVA
jgi:hypothetical protein